MDEIAKEYDVIVLGTGMSAVLNPAMWGSSALAPRGARFLRHEAIALIVMLGRGSVLLTTVVLPQV